MRLFADDVSIYAKVSSVDDCLQLQEDLSCIYKWAVQWQLTLNPCKCEAISITNKRSPISFTYRIGQQPISRTSKVKYLGILIQSKLHWSDHCRKIAHKASLCLNHLRRAMFSCTAATKHGSAITCTKHGSLAYKALVRPCLEYGCSVWSPHTSKDINVLESVQRREACWIQSKYDPNVHKWTKSSDVCLKELRWPTLALRRQYYVILMLYSILHNLTPITFTRHFELNTLPTRSHPLTLISKASTINAYRCSFFVNTEQNPL